MCDGEGAQRSSGPVKKRMRLSIIQHLNYDKYVLIGLRPPGVKQRVLLKQDCGGCTSKKAALLPIAVGIGHLTRR